MFIVHKISKKRNTDLSVSVKGTVLLTPAKCILKNAGNVFYCVCRGGKNSVKTEICQENRPLDTLGIKKVLSSCFILSSSIIR